MKYRVHLYVVMRVPVDVEADSMTAAIKVANDEFDPKDILGSGEYADETVGYLVDPLLDNGEADTDNSVMFDLDKNGKLCIEGVPVPEEEEVLA